MSIGTTSDKVPSLSQEIVEAVFGLGLLVIYLTIFTVGSQVSGDQYKDSRSFFDSVMFVLTYRETSVCLLAIIAACLGTWRRINQAREGAVIATNQPWFLAYTSACIGGLITTAVVVGLPNLLDQLTDQFTLSRDFTNGAGPRNYMSMAMLASAVAFFSGYDKTFLDRILGMINKRFGLAETPAPASAPVVNRPRYESSVPVGASRTA